MTQQPTHGKTALVVGATGATGQHLVAQLLEHPGYASVVTFARRELPIENARLTQHVIDFAQPDQWQELMVGDELFSALGTTMAQAGSKEAQYRVDVTYQLYAAIAAANNGVPALYLVSSPNASPRAASFYLRMKGELDAAITELDFMRCVLIKPSIIDAERPDGRLGEKIAGSVLNKLSRWLPPIAKYRPITSSLLARAIVNIAQTPADERVSEVVLDELFDFLD